MGSLIDLARKLRPLIEKAAQSLDEKEASEAAELFPHMKLDGSLISAGTKINWNGKVKIAAVDLWSYETNTPDNAPTIWKELKYKDGYRIIPDPITVTEAFALGEKGWWEDALYESLLASNTYTPSQYAAGWKKIEVIT